MDLDQSGDPMHQHMIVKTNRQRTQHATNLMLMITNKAWLEKMHITHNLEQSYFYSYIQIKKLINSLVTQDTN